MGQLSRLRSVPVKRLVLPIAAMLALVVSSTAYAALCQPTRAGSDTHARGITGRCAIQRDGWSRTHLHAICYSHSSATLTYRFSVPRSARGIVASVQYAWAGRGVYKHLSRSGTRVTVTVHVPASSGADITRVWLRFYR